MRTVITGTGPAGIGPVMTGPKLAIVKRVLLAGMSGTGKSRVIEALAALGYRAADTGDPQ
jgi:hypothetical protein